MNISRNCCIRSIGTIPITFLVLLFGCSERPQEVEISVQGEGLPDHSIRILIEGRKDVLVEDPYAEEIQRLSNEFETRRSRYVKELQNLTPEERKAYGIFRDQTGERIRELQKLRRDYVRAKMDELGGTSFQLEQDDFKSSTEGASNYMENLNTSQ